MKRNYNELIAQATGAKKQIQKKYGGLK